jgi:Mrp family chromosome partitioning ATPase
MDREIIDGEAEFQILQQRGLLSFTETYDPARAEQYRAHRKANDQKIRLAERTTESRSVPKASKSVSHESRSIPKVSSPIEAAEPRSAANALKQRKPTVWIVSEFGAASALVILAAEKGIGKSSLCYALAAAISDGSKFLNQCETV